MLQRVLKVMQPIERLGVAGGDFMRCAVVLEQQRLQRAEARCNRFEDRVLRIETRLLRDESESELRTPPHRAAVERTLRCDDFHERRLARAVASDQRDALAGIECEVSVVEQRLRRRRQATPDRA